MHTHLHIKLGNGTLCMMYSSIVSAPAIVQDTTQPIRRSSGVSLRTTTQ